MGTKDFFISYNKADSDWAEWVAWTLNKEGYTTIIQAWDFRSGENFVLEMQRATSNCKRTIAILSSDYLKSQYTQSEWAAAFAKDPTGAKRLLIPVRVRECDITGILNQINYIDLVGVYEDEAKSKLIEGVRLNGKGKPVTKPSFPNSKDAENEGVAYPKRFPINNLRFHRNPYFTGREKELEQLHRELKSGNFMFQVITGNAGYGKTQIAIEYIFRYSGEYNLIWWINADNETTFIEDIKIFVYGQNLINSGETESTIIIRAIQKWMQENEKWLFVIDNAIDLKTSEMYLPAFNKGHIIITSRYQEWSSRTLPIDIDVLSDEESKDFFKKRTGEYYDETSAAILAEKLGNLPLAMELAAAYIINKKKTFSSYIRVFEDIKIKTFEGSQPEGYPYSLGKSWNITINEIHSNEAKQLLYICALLAPDGIKLNMFLKGNEKLPGPLNKKAKHEFDLDEIISELTAYSLVKKHKDNSISIHRLLQEVIIKILKQSKNFNKYYNHVVDLLSDIFRYEQYKQIRLEECFDILPHALTVIYHLANNSKLKEVADLLNTAGMCFERMTSHRDADPVFKSTMEIREKLLGVTSNDTTRTINNLVLICQGKNKETEQLYKSALTIRESILSENDPEIAISLNNLAVLYSSRGKYADAEPLFKRALTIREQVLGEKHPETAISLNDLALLYKRQYRYKEAEALFKRALEIREEALGSNHQDTSVTLDNLAELYDKQGKYRKAERLYKKVVEINQAIFGERHVDTAVSLNKLAFIYVNEGKYKQAEVLYKEAIEIMENILGKKHPYTAIARSKLAELYDKQGRDEESTTLSRSALEVFEQWL